MWQIVEKGFLRDNRGRPLMTLVSDSNPWWSVFNQAVTRAGGKLSKPEMLASTTDARFMRSLGIPVFGFSPMKNTPILLHDHNEVCHCFYLWKISHHLFLWCQSFVLLAVPQGYCLFGRDYGVWMHYKVIKFLWGVLWTLMQWVSQQWSIWQLGMIFISFECSLISSCASFKSAYA